MLKHAIWISLMLIVISACEASDTYDYGFDTGSYGGTDWPIWVEKLVFNESWGVPVGNLSGGLPDTSTRLPEGTAAGMGWVPLPHTIRARWFSYRTQTFYEATLEIPEEKRVQIKQWFKQYPRKGYSHSLVTGISGEGSMQAWWSVICVNFGCPEYESHSFELTPRVPATVAEGDPNQYRERTKGEIKDGTIPTEVLDLLPPETDSSALK